MKLSLVALALSLAAASFAACSDNADDAPRSATEASDPVPDAGRADDGDAPPSDASSGVDADVTKTIAAFDEALASAVCARLASCCADSDYATYFQQFQAEPFDLKAAPPRASCASTLAHELGIVHGKWAKSISVGRMTLDPVRAQKCIADVEAAACGVPLATTLYDAACFGVRGNQVFTKIAPVGAACEDIGDGTFYGECDPSLGYCGSSKKCEAWKKTGEPCSITPTRAFCAPDLACDGLTPSKPGTCTEPPIVRAVGEPCGSVSGPFIECAAGAYCDYFVSKCVAKKADGVACQTDEECATAHPYTCTPYGNGTCGSSSFCSGSADGGQ